jgi:hypothetical protein
MHPVVNINYSSQVIRSDGKYSLSSRKLPWIGKLGIHQIKMGLMAGSVSLLSPRYKAITAE